MVGALGLQSSDFLMSQLHHETLPRFVAWLLVGLAFTFSYGRKRSHINPHEPRHGKDVVLPLAETQKSAAIKTAALVGAAYRYRQLFKSSVFMRCLGYGWLIVGLCCIAGPRCSGFGGDPGGSDVVVSQCLGEDWCRVLECKVSYCGGSAAWGRDAEFVQETAKGDWMKGLFGTLSRE